MERFLREGPIAVLGIAAVAIAVIKGGIYLVVPDLRGVRSVLDFNTGASPTSLGLRGINDFLQLQGDTTRLGGVMLVLTLIALLILAFGFLSWDRDRGTVITGFVVIGPIGTVLLGNIGSHDWFLLLGSVALAAKLPSLAWALPSTALMVLGNPEQAVVALSCLWIVSLVPRLSFLRKATAVCLVTSLSLTALLTYVAQNSGAATRASLLDDFYERGLVNFILNLPLGIYAAYGAGWLVIILFLRDMRGFHLLWAVLGTLVLPSVVTALTVDQTRVFVGVSCAAFIVIVRVYSQRIVSFLQSAFHTSWRTALVFALVLLPSIEITFTGGPRIPYSWVSDFVLTHM